MNTQVTNSQLNRVVSEWQEIAGETLQIKATSIFEPVFAFGSELACLRLEHKMKCGHAAYSENLNSWYYVNQ